MKVRSLAVPHGVLDPKIRAVALCVGGVLMLTPDALILRLAEDAGPFEVVFLRSTFLTLGWIAMLTASKGDPLAAIRGVSRLGFAAAFVQAGAILGFVTAVQSTTIANALVLFASFPAFAAIAGYVLMRERVDPLRAATILLSFAGVALICWDGLGLGSLAGDAAALAAGACYGVYIALLRASGREEVLETLCLSGVIAAAATLPFADLASVPIRSALLITLQSGLLLPLAFALYFRGVEHLPAAQVALIGLLEPVLGPVWAWTVLGEAPSLNGLAGGAIVIGTVAADSGVRLLRRRRTPGAREEACA